MKSVHFHIQKHPILTHLPPLPHRHFRRIRQNRPHRRTDFRR